MNNRTRALSMFGVLYFVQGSALAYIRNFHKPYLDSFDIHPDIIGLMMSILLVPFMLKIFTGMLSDKVNLFGLGHRKPYIIIGLIVAGIGFVGAAFVSPDMNLVIFGATLFLASFSVTVYDSAVDGYAIDVTPREEQGTVQSVMVGGRAIGFIILSLVFGQLVGALGYPGMFIIIGAIMLIPLLWVLPMNEPERHVEQEFDWQAFSVLKQPRFMIFALYAVVYATIMFGVDGLPTFFMSNQFAAADASFGSYGVLRGIGAVVGALAAALIIKRIGRRATTFASIGVLAAGAAAFGLAPNALTVLLLGLPWGIAWGFQETIFVSLAMDLSDTRIAASMFALMMALSNVGTAIGEGVFTALTDDIGFAAVFFIAAGMCAVLIPIVWAMFRIAPELRSQAA